jgi:hypothetical protein
MLTPGTLIDALLALSPGPGLDDREVDLFMEWHFDICEESEGNPQYVLDCYEPLFALLVVNRIAERLTISGALAPLCVCNPLVFGDGVRSLLFRAEYLQQLRLRLTREEPDRVDRLLKGL